MNYTSKNTTAPQNINRLTAIGLPIRNIFTSVISLFLLSFFTLGVKAQPITINSITPAPPVCAGTSITINFTFTLSGNNIYTGTLSQANGTFVPSALATSTPVSFVNAGTSTVTLTIPTTATTSSLYVVHVTSGAIVGTSLAFTINALPTLYSV